MWRREGIEQSWALCWDFLSQLQKACLGKQESPDDDFEITPGAFYRNSKKEDYFELISAIIFSSFSNRILSSLLSWILFSYKAWIAASATPSASMVAMPLSSKPQAKGGVEVLSHYAHMADRFILWLVVPRCHWQSRNSFKNCLWVYDLKAGLQIAVAYWCPASTTGRHCDTSSERRVAEEPGAARRSGCELIIRIINIILDTWTIICY